MSTTFSVATAQWTSSGVTLPAGWGFSLVEHGSVPPTNGVEWGTQSGSVVYSYPEGRYPPNSGSIGPGPFPQTTTYNPALCTAPPATGCVDTTLPPQCMMAYVPSSGNPGTSPAPPGSGIAGDRTLTVPPGDSRLPVGGGVVWLWYNDGPVPAGFVDNFGTFTVTITPIAPDIPVPAAPTVTIAAGCVGGHAVLSWGAVTNATGYQVFLAGQFLADVGNVLTYDATGLLLGVPYTFTVIAYNGAVMGPASTPVVAVPCMDAPTGLVWFGCDNTAAALQWDGIGGVSPIVTAYNVYRDGILLATIPNSLGAGNSVPFTDTGLTIGQTYRYQVSAVSAAGEGALSPVLSVTACCHCAGFTVEANPTTPYLAEVVPVNGFGRESNPAPSFSRIPECCC